MNTVCAKCNSPMSCCPQGNCWCADYPKTQPDPETTSCLCPECLREKLQSEQKPQAKIQSAG